MESNKADFNFIYHYTFDVVISSLLYNIGVCYLLSAAVVGFASGVKRKDLQGYPASPSR